jgi:hypothetical protein
MRREDLKSSFTLALQSLDTEVLQAMSRRNMRLNEWEDLARWLAARGFECYAELIWGAPGERPERFLEAYDHLAEHCSRIAVYPLLLLPNTEYSANRAAHGFVTVRGDADDFEYVLAHRTMTFAENERMQRFMLWARVVGENLFFRHLWTPVRLLGGLSQSAVLLSLDEWFAASEDPAARELLAHGHQFVDSPLVAACVRRLHGDERIHRLLDAWWREAVLPRVPAEVRAALTAVYEYDKALRPVFAPEGCGLDQVVVDGEAHHVRHGVELDHDVPAMLQSLRDGVLSVEPAPVRFSVLLRAGFAEMVDNHELSLQYWGRCVSGDELDLLVGREPATG